MKTVQLLLIFLAAFAMQAGATNKVDSLKQILQTHAAADKAEVLWAIAYELFDVDNPQALFYAERAYEEVWAKGDSLQIVKVGTTYGQLLRRLGELDRSIEVSSRLLPIARRHDFRVYRNKLLNSLGLVHLEMEEFSRSLEYLYESLILKQSDLDTIGITVALQNLGYVHYRLGDHELAYGFMQDAIGMHSETTDSVIQSIAYLNIGAVLQELGKQDSAMYFLRKAIRYSRKVRSQGSMGSIHHTMALAHFATGKLDSTKYHSNLALYYSERQKDKWISCRSNLLLSQVFLKEKDLTKSSQFLSIAKSISAATEYGDPKLLIVRQSARIAAASGRFVESIRFYEDFARQDDSVYHGDQVAHLRRVQTAFQQHENRAKINAQSAVMSLQQKAIDQQKVLIGVVTTALLAVIILTFALQRANRKIRHINEMLDQKVVERTRELGYQRDALQHLFDEQVVLRHKFSKELGGITGSILGLVHLAKVDIHGNTQAYLNRTYELTSRIKEMATQFGFEKRSLEQATNYRVRE